ncbi:hypothetical protein VTN77DRAFT_3074 [Rasamsonia byssochlamydoides]|uniref:uncharacterized protein n=1 Tax=Rasamsonia byssochlamydoides TaxID=89139 RepID=UPI00374419EC
MQGTHQSHGIGQPVPGCAGVHFYASTVRTNDQVEFIPIPKAILQGSVRLPGVVALLQPLFWKLHSQCPPFEVPSAPSRVPDPAPCSLTTPVPWDGSGTEYLDDAIRSFRHNMPIEDFFPPPDAPPVGSHWPLSSSYIRGFNSPEVSPSCFHPFPYHSTITITTTPQSLL